MDTNITSPDLVIIDVETDEDPSTGSEIAKTLLVATVSTAVVAGSVIAYNRIIKPRVHALFARKTDEAGEVIEGIIVEDITETEKV